MFLQELEALTVEIDVGVAVCDFHFQILKCVDGSNLTCVEFKCKGGRPCVCVRVRAINIRRLVSSNPTRVSFIIMLKYFYNSNMFQPN
jgi:hypothetical protein